MERTERFNEIARPLQGAVEESVKKQVLLHLFADLDKHSNDQTLDGYIRRNRDFLEHVWKQTWDTRLLHAIKRADRVEWLEEVDMVPKRKGKKEIDRAFLDAFPSPLFDVKEWLETEFEGKWEDFLFRRLQTHFMNTELRPFLRRLIEDEDTADYLTIRQYVLADLSKNSETAWFYEWDSSKGKPSKTTKTLKDADLETVADVWRSYTGQVKKKGSEKGKRVRGYTTYRERYDKIVWAYIRDERLREWLEKIQKRSPNRYEGIVVADIRPQDIPSACVEDMKRFAAGCLDRMADVPLSAVPLILEKTIMEHQQEKWIDEKAEIERLNIEKERREREILHIFGNEYEASGQAGTKYVLHLGDTNTGKTYQSLQMLMRSGKGVYLAPLRLLALEVFDTLNKKGIPCNLRTGEETKEVDGASHDACTVEMFDGKKEYDVVVIDEAQMMADKDRGFSWYRAIAKARAKEVHIIGSPSVQSLLLDLLGDVEVEVREYKRQTPLVVQQQPFHIQHVEKGDALVAFSRKRVLQIAAKLEEDGHAVSVIYGNMPPESRQRQMEQFAKSETSVLVATDAIGMGLNLPIRRVIFMDSEKFDGVRRRPLKVQEIKQIAGRAGRKGLYEEGVVVFPQERKKMKRQLESKEPSLDMFTIAPTRDVLERFSKQYRDLGTFFSFWDRYKNPKGTNKASLSEEKALYASVKGTVVERAFPMVELYTFLQIPFSSHHPALAEQWKNTMLALSKNEEWEEPKVEAHTLEEMEFAYQSVELHLMFLYRLGKETEAYYWERVKKGLSSDIDSWLKQNMKTCQKTCNRCKKTLAWDYPYGICQRCFRGRNEEEAFSW